MPGGLRQGISQALALPDGRANPRSDGSLKVFLGLRLVRSLAVCAAAVGNVIAAGAAVVTAMLDASLDPLAAEQDGDGLTAGQVMSGLRVI